MTDPWRTEHAPPTERGGRSYLELRREDIETLRRFRNDQIEVLRQEQPIAAEEQERWFDQIVVPTHRSERPEFLLVSILDSEGVFVGYGGLTSVSWTHCRAELSFLVDPERAGDPDTYRSDFLAFLEFLTDWAFEGLGLHRLHSETYSFRTPTIELLEEAGFVPEGRLREHTSGPDGYVDSLLHGLLTGDAR